MELLDLVLAGVPGWSRERAEQALESRRTSFVGLPRPLPVRLAYETVTVDRGQVRILPDLYGLDAAYLQLLDAPRPAAVPAIAQGLAPAPGLPHAATPVRATSPVSASTPPTAPVP